MVDFCNVTPVPKQQEERFTELACNFEKLFKTKVKFYSRAPGRVNTIGEHVDYCGYAVLPMALEQDIVAAVSINNNRKLVLHNTDPRFSPFECDVDDITIDKNKPEWYKYFLCGLKGVFEHMSVSQGVGMNCLVDGNVPKSAGLSSSSALVCCAALACAHANGFTKDITKKCLAELCARSERYIGTEGGGMDQAISFLAEAGKAKLIEFNPLTCQDVILPAGATFVVTNSCEEMNKAASSHFNIRVVEGRIATQVIAKLLGFNWRDMRKPKQLQLAVGKVESARDLVDEHLHKDQYSKAEICEILEVTADELATTSLSDNTLHVEQFQLHDRLRHVFCEAKRVNDFQIVCQCDPPDCLVLLGKMMNASHHSLAKLYDCSSPELDRLVEICRQSGAIGSRMTGAGWGGCAVSLVPTSIVDDFMSKVKATYYIDDKKVDDLSQVIFATKPGGGAALYEA